MGKNPATTLKHRRKKVVEKTAEKERFVFRLFIAGTLPNSSKAIENITAICKTYLEGRYDLEIIDIYQQPALAMLESIIALPVLIKKTPFPEARLIGDLSNTEEVLKGLHLS